MATAFSHQVAQALNPLIVGGGRCILNESRSTCFSWTCRAFHSTLGTSVPLLFRLLGTGTKAIPQNTNGALGPIPTALGNLRLCPSLECKIYRHGCTGSALSVSFRVLSSKCGEIISHLTWVIYTMTLRCWPGLIIPGTTTDCLLRR